MDISIINMLWHYANNIYNHEVAPLKLETSISKCPYAGCGAAPKETLPNKNFVYIKDCYT